MAKKILIALFLLLLIGLCFRPEQESVRGEGLLSLSRQVTDAILEYDGARMVFGVDSSKEVFV